MFKHVNLYHHPDCGTAMSCCSTVPRGGHDSARGLAPGPTALMPAQLLKEWHASEWRLPSATLGRPLAAGPAHFPCG